MGAQALEQGQEGQPQDAEEIALDPLKELGAQPLELVAADGGQNLVSRHVEVILQKALGQGTHRELDDAVMVPQALSVTQQAHAGMKTVSAPGEFSQLRPGILTIRRLVEPRAITFQELIGPDHQCAWTAVRHRQGLQFRQGLGRLGCARLLRPE